MPARFLPRRSLFVASIVLASAGCSGSGSAPDANGADESRPADDVADVLDATVPDAIDATVPDAIDATAADEGSADVARDERAVDAARPDDAVADAPPTPDAGSTAGAVLFGGCTRSCRELLGDTWIWDGRAWARRDVTGPSARNYPAMATLAGQVVLFSGTDASGYQGDTWTWDGRAWTRRDVTGPSGRTGHAMATLGDRVVLFGGRNRDGFLNDTWTWDGMRWQRQTPAQSPPARTTTAMATRAGEVVLFGGWDADDAPLADTWTWDGSAWTQRRPSRSPSARGRHAMASSGTDVTLFGGNDLTHSLGDTWRWDGTTWTEQGAAVEPRDALVMISVGGTLMRFGGAGMDPFAGEATDTWLFGAGSWSSQALPGPAGRWFGAMATSP